ncbi:MAG: hypothetical protein J7K36_09285 [Archaeoglobaceae archaeon]|nr:hypothetical protein [Archaeoglobaceae archaeon]
MAKYLTGWIDLGIGGRKRVYLFKNDRRENRSSPIYYIKTRTKNGWKTVGKLYIPNKLGEGNEG